MKDIKLEDVLPINAMQYFTNFIETPDAKLQYLVSKGHSDIDVGPWAPCSTQGMFERVSIFSSNLSNNALVKKLTGSVSLKVTETQRYFFEKQGDLHVVSTMVFAGSSLAESFSSEVEWIVHTLPNDNSEIKCNVKTEYRGFMFKGLIEKYVHQAACDSFHHWLKAVREKITLLENEATDQYMQTQQSYIPSSTTPISSSPMPEEDDDDDEDDVFYDSLEMAPPPSLSSSASPPSLSSSPPAPSTAPMPLRPTPPIHEYRTSPPLTATATSPYSTTSQNHMIFTTYNAGRPALTQPRALSPPANYSVSSSSSSVRLVSPLSSSFSSTKPPAQVRAWESAGDAERREVEDYKQRFAQMVTQSREREREWDERLLRMTRKMDAHARRTRWYLAALASFAVIWPGLLRVLLRFLVWIWPLLRARFKR